MFIALEVFIALNLLPQPLAVQFLDSISFDKHFPLCKDQRTGGKIVLRQQLGYIAKVVEIAVTRLIAYLLLSKG